MGNLNLLTINSLFIGVLFIGMLLLVYGSYLFLDLKRKGFLLFLAGAVLVFTLEWSVGPGKPLIQINNNKYSVSLVVNRLEISRFQESGLKIIKDTEVSSDFNYTLVARVKCNFLDSYNQCLSKFVRNEDKIALSYSQEKNIVMVE